MRQRSASRAKAWLKKKKVLPEATTPLRLCYWNCNGLGCVLKQQQIAEVMEGEQIDLMLVDETHFRFSANNDLSAFSPSTQYYRERNYGDKNGRGKMVLVSDRIVHSPWSPENAAPWVENERTWIIIHNLRLAICLVYMAAEVAGATSYKDWNREPYSCSLDKRAWMRAQLDIHNRQFWSLYDRTQKKKGKLTALKDADGELLTDIRKIENFALDHLALQFCGMRSPIF